MNSRLFLAIAYVIINFTLASANGADSTASATVKSIDVQIVGPKAITKEKVLEKLQTRVGKAYSSELVEADISVLSEEENVANVRIFGEPAKDGMKVTVVIRTKAPAKAKP
jgi:outer membrane protein assembly factor BamA